MKVLKYADIALATTAIIMATGVTIYSVRRISTIEAKLLQLADALSKRIVVIDGLGSRLGECEQRIDHAFKQISGQKRNAELLSDLVRDVGDLQEALVEWSQGIVDELKLVRPDSKLGGLSIELATAQPAHKHRGQGRSGGRGNADSSRDQRSGGRRPPPPKRGRDENSEEEDDDYGGSRQTNSARGGKW